MNKFKQQKALVIEDFPEFAQSVKGMLLDIGIQHVDIANTGEVALEAAKSRDYQVFLSDYNLGNGKNGMQVLEELHHTSRLKSDNIFIMVTAENTTAMVMGAIEYQPDAYLTKPFNVIALRSRLDKISSKKSALQPVLSAMDKHKYIEAVKLCDKLAEEFPKYKMAIKNLKTKCLVNAKQYPAAIKIFDEVIEHRPIPWALLGKAQALIKSKQFPAAAALLEDTIKQYPMILEAYDLLSQCQLKLKQNDAAQSTLEIAVNKSPNAIRRQNTLGQVAMDNQQFEVAHKAFRKAVRLGKNSIHKSADNYLKLVQSVAKQVESDDFEVTKGVLSDTQNHLTDLYTEFRTSKISKLQGNLVEAELMGCQGYEQKAQQLVERAKHELNSLEEMPTAEEGLNIAQSLIALGDKEAGEQVLKDCVEQNFENAAFIEKALPLLSDKSVFEKGRAAQKLNTQGIKHFENRQYSDALESFTDAVAASPQNISIILNTVQVMLKVYQAGNHDPGILENCDSYLTSIKKLPFNDKRYARYTELKRLTQMMISEI